MNPNNQTFYTFPNIRHTGEDYKKLKIDGYYKNYFRVHINIFGCFMADWVIDYDT